MPIMCACSEPNGRYTAYESVIVCVCVCWLFFHPHNILEQKQLPSLQSRDHFL
uniref:Uncharacterized protein n=1 Tax=Anguilla anguilla TaxID=7936 RepID=A0A0E9XFI3_ANGAN